MRHNRANAFTVTGGFNNNNSHMCTSERPLSVSHAMQDHGKDGDWQTHTLELCLLHAISLMTFPYALTTHRVLMPRIVTQSNQSDNYVFLAPLQVDLVVILCIKWWGCKVRVLNACEIVMLASTGEARWCRLDKQEHSLRKSKARSCR